MGASAPKPEIDQCGGCGRLFPRTYVRLCRDCVASEEKRFLLVRDFLISNQGASIGEISVATGLSRGEVARFHSTGRLVDVAPSSTDSPERCTCTGAFGERCAYCRRQLAQQFEAMRGSGAAHSGQGGPARDTGLLGAADESDRVRYVRRSRRGED